MLYAFLKMKEESIAINQGSPAPAKSSLKEEKDYQEGLERKIEEINSRSETILLEIEKKQKELLQLYNLIDEQKREITKSKIDICIDEPVKVENVGSMPEIKRNKKNKSKPQPKNFAEKTNIEPDMTEKAKEPVKQTFALNNPKHNEILNLSEKGMEPSEIAKSLGIGQGEVKLILELRKVR